MAGSAAPAELQTALVAELQARVGQLGAAALSPHDHEAPASGARLGATPARRRAHGGADDFGALLLAPSRQMSRTEMRGGVGRGGRVFRAGGGDAAAAAGGQKFDQDRYDAYMLSLVSLSDEHINEMYKLFSLIDVEPPSPRLDDGDGDARGGAASQAASSPTAIAAAPPRRRAPGALLVRLGVDVSADGGAFDKASATFLEFVTNKLGECIGTPQFIRVPVHRQSVRGAPGGGAERGDPRRAAGARRGAPEREGARRRRGRGGAQRRGAAPRRLLPAAARGGRRRRRQGAAPLPQPELKLLPLADEMRRVPTHQWRAMVERLRQQGALRAAHL